MGSVLVTDASERTALAVIRSLGKRGIKVLAADTTKFNAGFLSKYCTQKVIYPSPIEDKEKFVKSLLRLMKNIRLDLLIPITDFTMMPIFERKEEFEQYVKVAAPPYEVAMKAYDKFQTISIAEKCGVPHPKTFLIDDVKTLREVASELNYPVVIKPRMKVFWNDRKAVMIKVTPINYAYNKEDLLFKYKSLMGKLKGKVPSDFFLLQEYAKGIGVGVEVLMDYSSDLIALFMHKRLREYPVTGGASTLRVSIWNRRLVEYSIKLLKEMKWQGVAMVEFKLNEENEDANLMEVNGRFWGSLPLAINAGVDFPYLLYKMIVEKDTFTVNGYKLGLTERWLIPGDLLWLLDSLLLSNGNPKFIALKKFLFSPFMPDDIISSDDFMPTIGASVNILHYLIEIFKKKRTIYGEVLGF
ncbi:MAG: ATP-grasp domain-containing protein [Candidatus Verstraetearchaeota archaeon]|nr:ATP-grasp domain-containing protein [Candidatus Verstraetearchaeota archaeon]